MKKSLLLLIALITIGAITTLHAKDRYLLGKTYAEIKYENSDLLFEVVDIIDSKNFSVFVKSKDPDQIVLLVIQNDVCIKYLITPLTQDSYDFFAHRYIYNSKRISKNSAIKGNLFITLFEDDDFKYPTIMIEYNYINE